MSAPRSPLEPAPDDWLDAVDWPSRWRGCEHFVVCDAGPHGWTALVALHVAWRADAQRCAHLQVIVVDEGLPARSALPEPANDRFAIELAAAWPPLTPNLHRMSFDGGGFVVLLVPMGVRAALAELVARVDAFHVTGPKAVGDTDVSTRDPRAMKGFGRLAAPGACLVAEEPSAAMRAGLVTAGFRFDEATAADDAGGPAAAAEPHVARFAVARFAPRVASPPSRASRDAANAPRPPRRAIVVGAGLAGCATAWALAECGWHCTLVDSHDALASEASGNPAGLFHGIFNRQDGRHARWHRAAALEASKAVRIALDAHHVSGAIDGVLRIEGPDADVDEMRRAITALGLPVAYIEALDAAAMSQAAGISLSSAGWWYRSGGWVDPAGLARSFVERAGGRVERRTGTHVERLRRVGTAWQLVDAAGGVLDACDTVVLANAADAVRLLNTCERWESPEQRHPPDGKDRAGVTASEWPLSRVRGQISLMTAGQWPAGALPLRPLTGAGYVVAIDHDRVMFGATTAIDDDDGHVRVSDHMANLRRLDTWVPGAASIDPARLEGRTAWRCVAADRLPVIGAVPSVGAHRDSVANQRHRLDQPRFVGREPGLYVFTALGSRGITWAALGAQTLAAIVTGSPCPIEASLLDAVDPARFVSRRARHGG